MTGGAASDRSSSSPARGPVYAVPGVFPTPEEAERLAETFREAGWYSASERRTIALTGDEPWDELDLGPDAAAAFHAWEPIDALLFARSFDASASLEAALTFARKWRALGLAPTHPDASTAGRRALRLGYLALVTGGEEWVAPAQELARGLESQLDPTDISIATTDAVVGLATLRHRLQGLGAQPDDVGAAAAKQTLAHFNAAFTPDGVHRSRSPGIHVQALDRLVTVLTARSLGLGSLGPLRRRAERFLAWVLDPTGAPANIGATTITPLTTAYARQQSGLDLIPKRVMDPTMRHAATAGRFGASPGTAVEVFGDSGFAVIKVPWPRRLRGAAPPSHLVLQAGTTDASAGNHGPVITWHDRGLRLFVEPGPPLDHVDHQAARYADDPASHNTVILGGSSDRSMTGEVLRFGSHRNRFHLQAQARSDDTTHDRTIVLDPGRWLLVLDRVDGAADDDVGVRFHLGDELDLLPSANGFTLLAGPEPVAWAVPLGAGTAMIPERGRVEPHPSGWWSPDGLRMVPNWVLGWDARGSTTFATVISLEGRPIRDEVDGPWIGWHTATRRVRIAVTEWGVSDVIVEPVRKKEVR